MVALRKDTGLKIEVLDLRDERDFNLFHVGGARRVDPAEVDSLSELRRLLDEPPSTITFLADSGEVRSLDAFKRLRAQGVQNVYVLEGGVNHWLDLYPTPACVASRVAGAAPDTPAYSFAYATGDSLPSAWPELPRSRSFRFPCERALFSKEDEGEFLWPAQGYAKKVKPKVRLVVKGGCG